MTTQSYPVARAPYPVPQVPERYDRDFLVNQLGNLSRAIPGHDRTITATSTMTTQDDLSVVFCDPATGSIAYTLLPAAQCKYIKVWLVQISTGTVTITGTVSGAVNPTVGGQYKAKLLTSDGVNFYNLSTL